MIEAVVALAVVAFVLAGIGSLFAAAANGSRALEQHVALLETLRLLATDIPPRAEFQTDNLTGELSGHRWQIRVSPFFGAGAPPPASPWMAQSVVIRVRSPSGAVMSLETVRLQRRPDQ